MSKATGNRFLRLTTAAKLEFLCGSRDDLLFQRNFQRIQLDRRSRSRSRHLDGNLIGDGGIDVNLGVGCPNGYDEHVPDRPLPSLQPRFLFPPPANRKDADCVALRKIDGGSPPDVGMNGTTISNRRAEKPLVTPGSADCPCLFGFHCSVDAFSKTIDSVERTLHREAQAV